MATCEVVVSFFNVILADLGASNWQRNIALMEAGNFGMQ